MDSYRLHGWMEGGWDAISSWQPRNNPKKSSKGDAASWGLATAQGDDKKDADSSSLLNVPKSFFLSVARF